MKINKEALFFAGVSILTFFFVVVLLAINGTSSKPIEGKVEIPSDSFVLGAENAKVTLVEFGDFQCPACKAAEPVLKQLMRDYEGKVKFVFRHFPLPMHNNALLAAQAAEAAGEQNKFWEYHDILYSEQVYWSKARDPKAVFVDYAKELNLDLEKFNQSMESKKIIEKIQRDKTEGLSLGIAGTPTFFLNGKQVTGNYQLNTFKNQIDVLLSK